MTCGKQRHSEYSTNAFHKSLDWKTEYLKCLNPDTCPFPTNGPNYMDLNIIYSVRKHRSMWSQRNKSDAFPFQISLEICAPMFVMRITDSPDARPWLLFIINLFLQNNEPNNLLFQFVYILRDQECRASFQKSSKKDRDNRISTKQRQFKTVIEIDLSNLYSKFPFF